MADSIYLDYAASTPVDPDVAARISALLKSQLGAANPSATHRPGRAAAAVIEHARQQVADLIGAQAGEIVWTSGATESDNLAIIGAAHFQQGRGRHVITSTTEHPAVLESCRALERDGFKVTYLRPDDAGLLDPDIVAAAVTADTILLSVMHVNNETGVVQDIAALGALCREHDLLFHVDAAQSAGRLPIDVKAQAIDLLSLSAHKMYGPKGAGALFLDADRCRRVEPLQFGGAQERGLRPGTLPTHQLAGMGQACELARQRLATDPPAQAQLRDHLWSQLQTLPGVLLNGSARQRVCHILNVSVTGVEGESLRLALRELAISSGSACASDSGEPSAVLKSLGRSDQLAEASLRFSLGRGTTMAELDRAVAIFRREVTRLRALAPTLPDEAA
ncbi:MAG: aminotransferase class V-fold PLP-dependent enzyme [Gammaproteobacteria bacterium]|nr:aminotransferase class V-fold PLP-dependent enzyme [Gammaproteobacteria bacterium]